MQTSVVAAGYGLPGHLVEHSATAQPVRVWFRTEGGVDLAIRLEDASPAAAS